MMDEFMTHLSCRQVKNEGDQDADVKLTMLALAVTYTSVHRGECQRQVTTVKVPARKGQQPGWTYFKTSVIHGLTFFF